MSATLPYQPQPRAPITEDMLSMVFGLLTLGLAAVFALRITVAWLGTGPQAARAVLGAAEGGANIMWVLMLALTVFSIVVLTHYRRLIAVGLGNLVRIYLAGLFALVGWAGILIGALAIA